MGDTNADPPRARVVVSGAQPRPVRWHDVRQRFLDHLGRKINLEHDKSFVKVS